MANRSYLYTHHTGEEPEYRDVSEWKGIAPISHLLLAGANPTVRTSAIWEVKEKIAIQGDAGPARNLFLEFLDWLKPQLPQGFHEASEEAKELLTRPNRQGAFFQLELGEVYELLGLELDEMEPETESNAVLAKELFVEVRRLIGTQGATLKDATHEKIRAIADHWEEELGLYFPGINYFHLGK